MSDGELKGKMKVFVSLEGFEELEKELQKFPKTLQKKIANKAVKAGSVILRDRVKKELVRRMQRARRGEGRGMPFSRGKLRKSGKGAKRKTIISKSGLYKSVLRKSAKDTIHGKRLARKGIVAEVVGFKHPMGAHAHLVEFGHKKYLWGSGPHTPKVPAYPFFRPAIRGGRNRAMRAMKVKLRQELDKEFALMMKRVRAKAYKSIGKSTSSLMRQAMRGFS